MKIKTVTCNGLVLNEVYAEVLKTAGLGTFDSLMGFSGGSRVKKKANRSVVKFTVDGEGPAVFFLKRHDWQSGESLKRFLKLPNLEDGRNEWDMTVRLGEDGFLTPVPVAYGERTTAGMVKSSLYLSEEIGGGAVRLSDYLPALNSRGIDGASIAEKRRIIALLGVWTRRFHDLGYNHQDFYLLHIFYRPKKEEFILVDLQRAHKRQSPVKRWVVKDLAQLTFSAGLVRGITRTDFMRFARAYWGKNKFDKDLVKMIKNIITKSRVIAARDARRRSAAEGSKS